MRYNNKSLLYHEQWVVGIALAALLILATMWGMGSSQRAYKGSESESRGAQLHLLNCLG
jgi:hypothetical protein